MLTSPKVNKVLLQLKVQLFNIWESGTATFGLIIQPTDPHKLFNLCCHTPSEYQHSERSTLTTVELIQFLTQIEVSCEQIYNNILMNNRFTSNMTFNAELDTCLNNILGTNRYIKWKRRGNFQVFHGSSFEKNHHKVVEGSAHKLSFAQL